MLDSNLLLNIAKYITLTDEELSIFSSLIVLKMIPKRTVILSADEDCKYLNYVSSGALRSYYIDSKGKESTIMFAVAGWWITDMYCYLNKKPAMVNIESIGDSVIYQINRANFDYLLNNMPKFEKFFRVLMQNAYTREQIRVIENLSLSAESRYKNFIKRYPQIVKEVSQKQIASYLGITPEFLSAIKNPKL